jgi:hypothetical protein
MVFNVKSSPCAYYNSFYFDNQIPVDKKRVSCGRFSRQKSRLKILPQESFLPDPLHYRDVNVISEANWDEAAENLTPACNVDPLNIDRKFSSIKDVRDYLILNVSVKGPMLYEIPIEKHITAPSMVLKDGYASRLDYIRTMVSLLKGAGFDARIVFAANNSGDTELVREHDIKLNPNVFKFSVPLAKVSREGKVYFVGFENEYTKVGSTPFGGSDYFDPLTKSFGKVVPSDLIYEDKVRSDVSISVRENGAVDYTSSFTVFGYEAGVWQKKYNSMLPEEFNRHYQGLLTSVAHAAEPQSELFATKDGYPFEQKFSCFVPHYAVIDNDVLTMSIPSVKSPLPNLPSRKRELPILLGKCSFSEITYSITFPKGYTRFEHLPKDLVIANPINKNQILYTFKVQKTCEDGVLKVIIKSTIFPHNDIVLPPEYAPLLQQYYKEINSQAKRLISVS